MPCSCSTASSPVDAIRPKQVRGATFLPGATCRQRYSQSVMATACHIGCTHVTKSCSTLSQGWWSVRTTQLQALTISVRLSAPACTSQSCWLSTLCRRQGGMYGEQTRGGKKRCLSGPLRQVDGDCSRCRSGFCCRSGRSGKDASEQLLLWLLHISLLTFWGLQPRDAAFGSRRGRLSDIYRDHSEGSRTSAGFLSTLNTG